MAMIPTEAALGPAAALAPSTGGLSLALGIPALFGAIGANKQAKSQRRLAEQLMAFGAPSRARFEESFSPNFDIASLPGLQGSMDTATDTLLRRLSAGSGNPFGDPGGLAEVMKYVTGNVALPQLNEYRRLNAGAGGLASLTAAAPAVAGSAIESKGNVLDALGAGAADVLNPPKSLSDILREVGIMQTYNIPGYSL